MYALNGRNGNLLWSYATRGAVEGSPAYANGVLYVASQDDNVYALDAASGTPLWSYSTGSIIEGSPAVASGVVYIGSNDNKIYAFGQTNGMGTMEPSSPPGLTTLHPNLSLTPSQPGVALPANDDQ